MCVCSVMSDFAIPKDCSLPDSSDHGIFQARILEWVAISFSRGCSRPRDWTCVSLLHLLHRQTDCLPLHHLGNPNQCHQKTFGVVVFSYLFNKYLSPQRCRTLGRAEIDMWDVVLSHPVRGAYKCHLCSPWKCQWHTPINFL